MGTAFITRRGTQAGAPYYELTIPSTYIDENLTDYPLVVKLTSSNFDFSLSANSNELYFTDVVDNLLSHEIEIYEPSNSRAVFHVKVPTVSASSDTIIKLYYDGTGYTNGNNPTQVWSSNYRAVYHLGDSLTDSSPNSTNIDSQSNTTAVNGLYSRSRRFQGNGYLNIPTNFNSTFSDFTIQALIKQTAQNHNLYDGAIISSGNWNSGGAHWAFSIKSYGSYNNTYGPVSRQPYPGQAVYDTNHDIYQKYVVLTYRRQGTRYTIHINNNKIADLDPPDGNYIPLNSNAGNTLIGRATYGGYFNIQADIDEVRLATDAKSDAWIKADYEFLMNDRLTVVAK